MAERQPARIRARKGTEKKFLSVEFAVSDHGFRKSGEAAKKAHDLLASYAERHKGRGEEIRDHQESIEELGEALGEMRGKTFNAEGIGRGGELGEAIDEFLKQKGWKIEPAKK